MLQPKILVMPDPSATITPLISILSLTVKDALLTVCWRGTEDAATWQKGKNKCDTHLGSDAGYVETIERQYK